MREDTEYQKTLLAALNHWHDHGHRMYLGTVPPSVKAKRRAKDRAAKAARKAQRSTR